MKRPIALVTGVAGFAGSFLAEELLANGYDVFGIVIKGGTTEHVDHLEGQINLVELDLQDEDTTARHISRIKPAYIFHLAGFASVGRSFEMERFVLRTNIEGTLNVLQPARALSGLRKLLFVSSADVYGKFSPRAKLLTEEEPVNPISPYAISKAAAEQLVLYYSRNHNLPGLVVRSFNHIGPRQREDFVVASFARQIAAIEAEAQPAVISVGDLSARRDMSDVRDIVSGYRLLAEKGKAGDIYQLCSGKAVSVQSLLDGLLQLSNRNIRVRVDKNRLRKSDIPVLRGDNSKAVQAVGYQTRYTLRETLADTLDYWRRKFAYHMKDALRRS